MIANFMNELAAALVQALPRVFLVGAPLLVIANAVAALLDARMPGRADPAQGT